MDMACPKNQIDLYGWTTIFHACSKTVKYRQRQIVYIRMFKSTYFLFEQFQLTGVEMFGIPCSVYKQKMRGKS